MNRQNTKISKAEFLLEEIGNIDDALIEEAISTKYRKKSPKIFLIAAAVAICFVFVLGVSVVMSRVLTTLFDKNNLSQPGAEEEYFSLDNLLLSKQEGGFFTCMPDELDYNTGNAYILWQYEGESEIYMSDALTQNQLNGIQNTLGSGKNVGEGSPELECKVWVLMPNGQVKSPYLKNTDGNTGVRIFDYDPEIYPTDDFINHISDIIG